MTIHFSAFCDNAIEDGEAFCPEHMHVSTSRYIRTLMDIGSKLDDKSKGYHIAAGIFQRVMKPEAKRKFYQYCPSTEGLLPAWIESVDHFERWLSVCYKIHVHPNRDSKSEFPVHLIYEEFPEISDIDAETYFHGFWAMYEGMRAYGMDKAKSWDRNVPTLLHQLGAPQQFIPYHKAIDANRYQEGERFVWEAGKQQHTYTKDLFDMDEKLVPVCPALRLKRSALDGTCSPSFEGIEDMKPTVSVKFEVFQLSKKAKN